MLPAFIGSVLVLWVFGLATSIFGGDLRGPAFVVAFLVYAVIFLRERELDHYRQGR